MSFLNNSPFGSANKVDVVEALSNAAIPTATVAPLDEVLIRDVDDSNNLKVVTAQDVADLHVAPVTSVDGLTGVVVLPRASQGEAELGTENTKIMTPLRVAQAIAQQANTLQNNLSAIVPPGATDDSSAGYSAGSFWIDTVADEAYRCVDATATAAVWVNTSLESTDLATVALSGDSDDLTEGTTNLLLTSAERTKLSGIEASATADQTDAEIKTAYENNANTNAFTDAEQTKLGTVETNADVTDEANVTAALDGATLTAETVQGTDKVLIQDTSDADNLKTVTAQSIADLAPPGAVTSVNGETGVVVLDADDISDAATTNKYTTAAEISKLAGIEANATADQTDAEIKTAYENNADTNEFSDAEQTKLAGIAAGAQVNTVDSVNTATGAVVLDADDISDAATTNKYTTVAEINKLAAIEALADVTDEANVTSSLDGATLTAVTVAGTDKVLVQDTSDSDNLKSVTAQSIADLGDGGISAPAEESFVATAGQTNFTLASLPAAAWVWLNGLAQDASTWSVSGNDIVLAPTLVGDLVEVYYLTKAGVAVTVIDGLTDVDTTTSTPSVGDHLEWDGSNWIPAAVAAAGGKVLQVVSATSATQTVVSSATYIDATGVSVTITPSSTSSTILVFVTGAGVISNANPNSGGGRVMRGGTQIHRINQYATGYGNAIACMVGHQHLDAPSTTSATTYKLQIASVVGSGNFTLNGTGQQQTTITAIEIGA